MESFNLPIYYIDNKKELDNHIHTDLEILKTNDKDNVPLYNSLFNPTSVFEKENLNLWGKYYTSDKNFLKDSQKFIKKFKYNELNYDFSNIQNVWENISDNETFFDKYNYIEYDRFKYLNTNSTFLFVWSMYNVFSPFLSLIIPILFLILPLIILKLQGVSIDIKTYIEVLKSLFKRHQIGQLFSLSSVSWDKRVYVIISFMFYIMQIYYNFVTCFKFIRNTNYIVNQLDTLDNYLDYTLDNITMLHDNISSLKTYNKFDSVILSHKNVIIDFKTKLKSICSYKNYFDKIKGIGNIMQLFYNLNTNKEIICSFEYSLYLNSYISNINNIKKLMIENKLNFCKFNNKKTKFNKAFYPIIDNPVKNSYNLNKHILITGPNAAGKTTILKTTIFNIIISQQLGIGFYKSANINLYNDIHCYINIPDTSGRDSLFQAEARRCHNILTDIENNKNKRHICVFDELFSGTNPYEAIASALSYLNYLSKYDNVDIIITTHFLELCKRLDDNNKFLNNNMHIDIVNSDMKYTYLLRNGISQIKGGVKVLKDLEYPSEIIDETKNIIHNLNI